MRCLKALMIDPDTPDRIGILLSSSQTTVVCDLPLRMVGYTNIM
jgi:hypothetical protein